MGADLEEMDQIRRKWVRIWKKWARDGGNGCGFGRNGPDPKVIRIQFFLYKLGLFRNKSAGFGKKWVGFERNWAKSGIIGPD